MERDALLEDLEAENDKLRGRIAMLEEALHGVLPPPIEFGLTPSEGKVLGCFMTREFVTRDNLMACLYRDNGKDEPEIKIVDVFVCKMRAKLKPFNIKIVTRWAAGYEMPAESKALVRSMRGEPPT